MAENKIELKSIRELGGMKFFIPNYQRGYRWTEQQVLDLLNDISDFINNQGGTNGEKDSFYCLQPLVIKENVSKEEDFKQRLDTLEDINWENCKRAVLDYTRWEVIDGQQRLTTIYILLSYLQQHCIYTIEYATRMGSADFLAKITNDDNNESSKNIDYYHMKKAYDKIVDWFSTNGNADKKQFIETLLDRVKFIWYESIDENPIDVFTRLNIGKIKLTNAELIKALLLNRSNFQSNNYNQIRLKQQEIASEWDRIEYALQNDEFWLFLHDKDYRQPTRIEWIFDIMVEQNSLKLGNDWKERIGSDDYRTFRYFYTYFNSNQTDTNSDRINKCWSEVKNIYRIFEEWYSDIELYHYVGYLVECKTKINTLLNEWKGEKSAFVKNYLTGEIKKKIEQCKNLDKQYELDGFAPKTACKPLLLLHNIQTIINQNNNFSSEDSYRLGLFYKFPFHLYKIEKWDVEHVDSNTTNDIDNDEEAQKEYALNIYNGVTNEQQGQIANFIAGDEEIKWENIKCMVEQNPNALSYEEKNKIWNFTLLDSSTNRSYGNSIFSAKRRIITGKDKGKLVPIPKIKDKQLVSGEEKAAKSAFIPICTKYIFMKYYSSTSANPNYWDKSDAEAYKEDILNTLKDFGVIDNMEDNKND